MQATTILVYEIVNVYRLGAKLEAYQSLSLFVLHPAPMNLALSQLEDDDTGLTISFTVTMERSRSRQGLSD